MKATLALITLVVLTSIIYPSKDEPIQNEEKQLPSIEEAIKSQQVLSESATDNLRTIVADIRADRDTIVETVVVTQIRRDTIVQENIIHDTVEKIVYKTITRSIYVGNQFNQTNNLKIDTSK